MSLICILIYLSFAVGVSAAICLGPGQDVGDPSLAWCKVESPASFCNSNAGPVASNRYGHTLVAIDEFVIMFGGLVENVEAGSARYSDDNVYVLDTHRYGWMDSGEQDSKPPARYFHSAVLYGGTMIIYGGVGAGDMIFVWMFDLTTLRWSRPRTGMDQNMTNTPALTDSYRFAHTATMLNEGMVVIGGALPQTSLCRSDVWRLSAATWSWSRAATSGAAPALCWHTTVYYDGVLMVAGGFSDVAATALSGSVYRLDPLSWRWSTLTATPPRITGALIFQARFVVFSGTCQSAHGCPMSVLHGKNQTWSILNTSALAPEDEDKATVATVAGGEQRAVATASKIVVLGGAAVPSFSAYRLITLRADDLTSLAVSLLHHTGGARPGSFISFPGRRERFAAAASSGAVVMFGGMRSQTGGGQTTFTLLADTWIWDLRTALWRIAQPSSSSPTARHGHTLVAAGGVSYLFGGAGGGFISQNSWLACRRCAASIPSDAGAYTALNDVWSFSVASEEWAAVATTGGPTAREGHSAVLVGGGAQMLVVGGVNFQGSVPGAGGVPPAAAAQHGDVWVLEVSSGAWSQTLTEADGGPGALFQHAAVEYGGGVLVTGGCRVEADGSVTVISGLWMLTASAQGGAWEWQVLSHVGMDVGRAGHSALVVGSSVVVFGGFHLEGCGAEQDLGCVQTLGDVWRLERGPGEQGAALSNQAEKWRWNLVVTRDEPAPRRHHVAVMAEGAYMVLGGGDEGVGVDGVVERAELNSSAVLPIALTMPNNTASHSGFYLAIAHHYITVLLPPFALFDGARVRSSFVVVEPAQADSLGSIATFLRVPSARALTCTAADACSDLTLRGIAVVGDTDEAEEGVLWVSGAEVTVTMVDMTVSTVHCRHAGCSAFVHQGAILSVHRSVFAGGSSSLHGGAVAVVEARAELHGCEFRELRAGGRGGAVAVVDRPREGAVVREEEPIGEVVASNCSWIANSAEGGGGAVSCGAEQRCAFSHSVFTNNSALGSSDGGAIMSFRGVVDVRGSRFVGNAAVGGAGGAMFWVETRPQVEGGDEQSLCGAAGSDLALYGACFASQATRIELTEADSSQERAGQFPGLWLDPHVGVVARDFYNQTVIFHYQQRAVAAAYVANSSTAVLRGAGAVVQSGGSGHFDLWDLAVMPAYSQVSVTTATLVSMVTSVGVDVVEPLTGTPLSSPLVHISFNGTVCPPHHVLDVSTWNLGGFGSDDSTLLGACTECVEGTYTLNPLFGLDDNGTHSPGRPACLPCPLGAAACVGSSVSGVGVWESDGSQYNLVSCPSGHALLTTSAGGVAQEGTHNLQRCEACRSDGSHYILAGGAAGGCQACPAGLQCFGNDTFVPRVAGSQWEWKGPHLVLRWCPEGYRISNTTRATQRCAECDVGSDCVGGGCVEECNLCGAGLFKDGPGAHNCSLCPPNTWSAQEGLTSVLDCHPCDDAAMASPAGTVSRDGCSCPASMYIAPGQDDGTMTCRQCPAGGRCHDGSCALVTDSTGCTDGTTILGEWKQRAGDGVFVLDLCPDGHRLIEAGGNSSVELVVQRCEACCAFGSYIVDQRGPCLSCPAGLVCAGGRVVASRVLNATWAVVDGTYVLQACPPGFIRGLDNCEPCGPGSESNGTHCLPCAAGTYKDQTSAAACSPCPRGSYGSVVGAVNVNLCTSCPFGAETAADAQTDASSCRCSGRYYLKVGASNTAGDSVECIACPTGALCADGVSCAFSVSDNATCPGEAPLVGEWRLDGDGRWYLRGCPAGTALVNSTNGTSSGAFSYEVQQCRECGSTDYVLDPNRFQCQQCDPGLQCFGNATVLIRRNTSQWELRGGVYHLTHCPAGHFPVTDIGSQECRPCAPGSFCLAEGCDACELCPAGTYKSIEGTGTCVDCPQDTYNALEGASRAWMCTSCGLGGKTEAPRSTSPDDCACPAHLYASRASLNASSALAQGEVCNLCPPGALCANGDCSLGSDLTCNGTDIVGRWELADDGRFRLVSCPAGHMLVNSSSGTSRGAFEHDVQQCSPCLSTEYIIHPNTGVCQTCPPGLQCFGNATVVPTVAGSRWSEGVDADGFGIFVLDDCPTGYAALAGVPQLQECAPCPAGSQCVSARCTNCSACPAGTYKDAAGTDTCTSCPDATFNPDRGASQLADCRPCPFYASTSGPGQTAPDACRCDDRYYPADEGENRKCQTCPTGGICSDSSCGLRFANKSCSDSPLVGEWELGADGNYRLVSCPEGHTLTNSGGGVFLHDIQACQRCDDRDQYVINPDTDQCQTCPPGLVCNGTALVRHVAPSQWVVDGDHYKLLNCSTGSFPFGTTTDPGMQECRPCPAGHQCLLEWCSACEPCPPGEYKDAVSTASCISCPVATYGPLSGADDRSLCFQCPQGSATSDVGASSVADCVCEHRYYRRDGDTVSCSTCPQGAVCSDGTCPLNPLSSCPDLDDLVGTWVQNNDTSYALVRCPAGYALTNAIEGPSGSVFSHDLQYCRPCRPGQEYVINPNTDSCQPCPVGLECFGSNAAGNASSFSIVAASEIPAVNVAATATAGVRPRVEDSVWAIEGQEWVLVSCGRGHAVARESMERQRCEPCGPGEHCPLDNCTSCMPCPPGSYKDAVGAFECTKCPVGRYVEVSGSRSLGSCKECPLRAVTAGEGAVNASQCFCAPEDYPTEGQDPLRCVQCPFGARCPDSTCALHADPPACVGAELVGEWQRQAVTGEYELVWCPDGFELVQRGGLVQQCAACGDEEYLLPTGDSPCSTCPPGLECNGTSAVTATVPGSVWASDGDQLLLRRCPEGYEVFNATVETQQCVPCGLGEEGVGLSCSSCQPGSYKEAAATSPCTLCPVGTFGPIGGATTLAQCFQCPQFASTVGPGNTQRSQCVCGGGTYTVGSDDDFSCQSCPQGAVCNDMSCAADSEDVSCSDGSTIVGEWRKDGVRGQPLLLSCPAGHALINSTAGTSSGTFAPDLQRCQRCEQTQYILDPDHDSCTQCPVGLTCGGDDRVVPRSNGSVWEHNGSLLVLVSCPVGHFVFNGEQDFDAAAQQCLPCPAGSECVVAPCRTCAPCQAGSYKDGGSGPCRPCPNNTFGVAIGASSLAFCRACPFGAKTDGPGQSAPEACVCEALRYAVDDPALGIGCRNCPQGATCATDCALQLTNLTCPDGQRIAGEWVRNDQHLFVLRSCPDGYALINSSTGTSEGVFSHDSQQCLQCPAASYNIDPNRYQCQGCPTGLACTGGAEVQAKQPGAVWAVDGSVYVLVSCPSGHFVSRQSQLQQECELCPAGEHCLDPNCTACSPCPPGAFKPSAGSYACRECPADTYLPDTGARSSSQCVSCPDGAVTDGPGQSELAACRCGAGRYSSVGSVFECFVCPQGAVCLDSTCALDNANLSCAGQRIVGAWDRAPDTGMFHLSDCPDGYALTNSTDGVFAHDLQACGPCSTDQYIIRQTDPCQTCPPGLVCDGTSAAVPAVAGSGWEVCTTCSDSGAAVYALQYCGSGHRPVVDEGIDQQRCESCGQGAECRLAPCSECTPCRPGTFKSSQGPSNCSVCPVGTYNPRGGATSVSECLSCPPDSFSETEGATNRSQCQCRSGTYPSTPPGGELTCRLCPIGAVCSDGSCAFEYETATCPTSGAPVGEWRRDAPTDAWVLVSCPGGHSLVNSTAGTSSGEFRSEFQECRACSAQQYIIDPNRHACQRCPLGLICNGSAVVPRVEGSVWVPNGTIYRLQACGTGHAVVSGSSGFVAEAQDCVPCGRGEDCAATLCTECTPCPPGSYKGRATAELCTPCPANTFGPTAGATAKPQCVACPVGATTSGVGHSEQAACVCSRRTYEAVHPDTLDMSCMACPDGALCRGSACSLHFGNNNSCPDAGDTSTVGTWRRSSVDNTFKLEACPDGHQLINSTDFTSSGTFSHDNQACKQCPQDGYIVSPMASCQQCIAGLICSGGSDVVSLVAGAVWTVVGHVYWLETCPTGYRRVGFENMSTASPAQVLEQTCVACDVGEECPLAACVECTACPPGSYKDSAGPATCRPCPLSTYGQVPGSVSLADCTACPTGAVTLTLGSTDPDACVCEPSTYLTAEDPVLKQIFCNQCPQGALCSDATCALRNENQTCDGTGPIPGLWVPDDQAVYYLRGCPEGYSLVNTTGGAFDYASQRCDKCLTKQFIIRPNEQDCQPCPDGLVCRGDEVVEARVPGSTWELRGDAFILTGCPAGYRFTNETILTQQCEPCGLGHECLSEPCFECSPCVPGYYKDTISNERCSICGRDTYNPDAAATNVANCRLCPRFATTANLGETRADACVCAPSTYVVWSEAGDPSCMTCPIGAQCDATDTCALRGDNLTCAGVNQTGEVRIVGGWARERPGGEFRVVTCPDGFSRVNALDGTSTGTFFHDAQQCRKCEAGRHYILSPNNDTCQTCPPGLICEGDQRVTPVTNGSNWVVDGSIYRLLWCPAGYKRYNGPPDEFRSGAQECRFCERGTTCLANNCTACDVCPAGSYKDEEGPGECKLCPAGFYSDTVGATTFGTCLKCPDLAHTDGPGKTRAEDCVCASTLYIVNPAGDSPVCKQCPAGAICNATDGRACALGLPNLECPSTGRIYGEWTRNAEDLFVLRSCPAGTSMMNSSTGTSSGIFSHDIQQCRPCSTCPDGGWCRSADYVADPNQFECKACPYGAECDGSRLRTVDSLDYIGAHWEVNSIGQYWIVSCPTGHRMMNHTGYENQQCKPCPEGEYVHRSDNPIYECHRCPEGGTCLNGGPPVFGVSAVSKTVTIQGLANSVEEFTPQKQAVVIASLEEAIPSLPGTVEITEICFTFGNQTLSCTTINDQTRRRSLPTAPRDALPVSSRALLQTDGGTAINFRVLSATETPATMLDKMSQPTFSSTLATTIVAIEPTLEGVAVPPTETPQVDAPPNSRGELYNVDEGGRALLWYCNPGHLLVNDTFKLQHCADCFATTYSLHAFDHVGADGIFTQRECSRCPRGAFCGGGTHFEALGGSQWEQVYNNNDRALVYRLLSCVEGHALVRMPNYYAEDQCLECPPTTYALEATAASNDYLRPERAEEVVGDELCLRCPLGAICPRGVQAYPKRGYWRGQNMICRTSGCNKHHNCNPGKCEAYPGAVGPGFGEEGELWRVRAMVYRCKAGRCRQKSTEQLRAEGVISRRSDNESDSLVDFSENLCFEGHKGVLCGVCEDDYAMTAHSCEKCSERGRYAFLVVGVVAFLACFIYYMSVWRPLAHDWEQWLFRCVPSTSEYDIVIFTPQFTKLVLSLGFIVRMRAFFRASMTSYFKLLVSYFQVSGNFVLKVTVPWPWPLVDLFLVMGSIFQLDVWTFPGMACYVRHLSFRDRMVYLILAIPGLILLFSVPSMIAFFRARDKLRGCLNDFAYASLFFLYMTYNVSARVTFEAFSCVNLGVDGVWVKSDVSAICPSNDPDQFTFWFAAVGALLFPLGSPFLMYGILVYHGVPRTIRDKTRRAYMLAILHKFKVQNQIPVLITRFLIKRVLSLRDDEKRARRKSYASDNAPDNNDDNNDDNNSNSGEQQQQTDPSAPAPAPPGGRGRRGSLFGVAAETTAPDAPTGIDRAPSDAASHATSDDGAPAARPRRGSQFGIDTEAAAAGIQRVPSGAAGTISSLFAGPNAPTKAAQTRARRRSLVTDLEKEIAAEGGTTKRRLSEPTAPRRTRSAGAALTEDERENLEIDLEVELEGRLAAITRQRTDAFSAAQAEGGDDAAKSKLGRAKTFRALGEPEKPAKPHASGKKGKLRVRVEEFRELVEGMGIQDVGFSSLRGMIDRYGHEGFIDSDGLMFMVHHTLALESVLTGNEDPDSLTVEQLRILCEAGQFEVAHYTGSASHDDETYRKRLRDTKPIKSKDDYKYEHEELEALLVRRVQAMLTVNEIDVPALTWDGFSHGNRLALDRIGFLMRAYHCQYWWYELVDMSRKLLIGITAVFVFDGTPSQVAAGTIITIAYLLVALTIKPFINPVLGDMHVYSLFMQAVTYFYGMVLATNELTNLAGEEDSAQRELMGNVVLIMNIGLLLFPLLDIVVKTLPSISTIRRLLLQAGALFTRRQAPAEEPEADKPEAVVRKRLSDTVMVEAQAVFDKQLPDNMMGYLMTLKQFVQMRCDAAEPFFPMPASTLTLRDPASVTDKYQDLGAAVSTTTVIHPRPGSPPATIRPGLAFPPPVSIERYNRSAAGSFKSLSSELPEDKIKVAKAALGMEAFEESVRLQRQMHDVKGTPAQPEVSPYHVYPTLEEEDAVAAVLAPASSSSLSAALAPFAQAARRRRGSVEADSTVMPVDVMLQPIESPLSSVAPDSPAPRSPAMISQVARGRRNSLSLDTALAAVRARRVGPTGSPPGSAGAASARSPLSGRNAWSPAASRKAHSTSPIRGARLQDRDKSTMQLLFARDRHRVDASGHVLDERGRARLRVTSPDQFASAAAGGFVTGSLGYADPVWSEAFDDPDLDRAQSPAGSVTSRHSEHFAAGVVPPAAGSPGPMRSPFSVRAVELKDPELEEESTRAQAVKAAFRRGAEKQAPFGMSGQSVDSTSSFHTAFGGTLKNLGSVKNFGSTVANALSVSITKKEKPAWPLHDDGASDASDHDDDDAKKENEAKPAASPPPPQQQLQSDDSGQSSPRAPSPPAASLASEERGGEEEEEEAVVSSVFSPISRINIPSDGRSRLYSRAAERAAAAMRSPRATSPSSPAAGSPITYRKLREQQRSPMSRSPMSRSPMSRSPMRARSPSSPLAVTSSPHVLRSVPVDPAAIRPPSPFATAPNRARSPLSHTANAPLPPAPRRSSPSRGHSPTASSRGHSPAARGEGAAWPRSGASSPDHGRPEADVSVSGSTLILRPSLRGRTRPVSDFNPEPEQPAEADGEC